MYAVKGWGEFQHYKDRNPPWIKLHRGLLDNIDYFTLSADAAKALPLIWILASERNGILPEAGELGFRLRVAKEFIDPIVQELYNAGFLRDASEKDVSEQHATPAEQAGWGSRHIPDKVKIAVWNRDGGCCKECSSTVNIEYDHIEPVSAGGSSEESNIQLLCRSCNRRKRTTLRRRSIESETEDRGRGQRQKNAFVKPTKGTKYGHAKSTGGDEGQRIAEKILAEARTVEA
jgi:5-methylcytosine-specific restriction endonuclease McrA